MDNGSNDHQSAFVPAICTQCGARLMVDPSREAAVCTYCNTPFVTTNAIHKYYTLNQENHYTYNTNNDTFIFGKKGVVQSVTDYMDRRASYRERKEEEERHRKQQAWNTVGKVFLWVCFFPIMLVVEVLRNPKIDTKKGLTIIGVVFALMFISSLISNRKNSDRSIATNSTTTTTTQDDLTVKPEWYNKTVTIQPEEFNVDTKEVELGSIRYSVPIEWCEYMRQAGDWTYYYPLVDAHKQMYSLTFESYDLLKNQNPAEFDRKSWNAVMGTLINDLLSHEAYRNMDASYAEVGDLRFVLLQGPYTINTENNTYQFSARMFYTAVEGGFVCISYLTGEGINNSNIKLENALLCSISN